MAHPNHAIDERTDEKTTRPPGNHRGGENDRITETNWPSKAPESPEIECTTCDMTMLVPRFEGEEDDQYETKDLPEVLILGTAAPDPCSVTENLDLSYARNLFEGHETFVEGLGVAQDTHRRSDLFFAVEDSPFWSEDCSQPA